MLNFETNLTGTLFVVAASMLWLGWKLLPVKIGDYFVPSDFSAVREHRYLWIWLYRLYLFGYIAAVMAFIAFAMLITEPTARILVWPAVAVLNIGFILTALAAAFYYHFGAWGSIDMENKSNEVIKEFVASLRVSTEYITCLIRFGRVFMGVGQVVLVLGLYQLLEGTWPIWLLGLGGLLGVSSVALTVGLPDNLSLYKPVFHLNVMWYAALGIATITVT